MADVVYRSEIRIERVKGPLRKAYLPGGTVYGGAHQRLREQAAAYLAERS